MRGIELAGTRILAGHFFGRRRAVSTRLDGSVVGKFSADGGAEVDPAAGTAKRAFPGWSALGSRTPRAFLSRRRELTDRNVETLGQVTASNGSLESAIETHP